MGWVGAERAQPSGGFLRPPGAGRRSPIGGGSALRCDAGAGQLVSNLRREANIKEEFISFQAIRGINIDFIDLIMGQMTPSIDHVKYFIWRKTGAGARRRGERVDVLRKGKKSKS